MGEEQEPEVKRENEEIDDTQQGVVDSMRATKKAREKDQLQILQQFDKIATAF